MMHDEPQSTDPFGDEPPGMLLGVILCAVFGFFGLLYFLHSIGFI